MVKVSQVTNDEERDEMQRRIIKASIVIDGMQDGSEKKRLTAAYDEMVRMMKAYDRAQYCKTYPGVRDIYEQLGWVVAEVKQEAIVDVPSASADSSTHEGEHEFDVSGKTPLKTDEDATKVMEEYGGVDWL